MHPATASQHAQPHPHQHPGPHTPSKAKPKLYNPRHPEQTLLYHTVAEHFETWLELASAGQFDGQGDHNTPPAYVEQAFRKYLECGIFAHGFARARCEDCGHDFFVAFSCKGRGVCPSCNTRRMAERAAHLGDHVFPRLAVRQWVLSVPKRLRYFVQRDGAALNTALRIFLRVIQRSLHQHCTGAAQVDKAFITDCQEVRKILVHIGVEPQAPRITPPRGPPLWDACDAQAGEAVDAVPEWDLAAQAVPDYEVDQRTGW